jgi:hypothetical protein
VKKAKLTKSEIKIKHLERLLERRKREVADIRRRADEQVAQVERKNAFTKFQLEAIKNGTWPL